MHHARTTFAITLVVLCGALLPAAAGAAAAAHHGPTSVKQARRAVTCAHRAVVRAKAAEREARAVLDATRRYGTQYGNGVGRWVRLARYAGWPWPQVPQLVYVIHRESGGNPCAKNPTSTASGLLQFLSGWWAGKWNPMDPYQNLRHGYLAWRQVGWQPWSLTAY